MPTRHFHSESILPHFSWCDWLLLWDSHWQDNWLFHANEWHLRRLRFTQMRLVIPLQRHFKIDGLLERTFIIHLITLVIDHLLLLEILKLFILVLLGSCELLEVLFREHWVDAETLVSYRLRGQILAVVAHPDARRSIIGRCSRFWTITASKVTRAWHVWICRIGHWSGLEWPWLWRIWILRQVVDLGVFEHLLCCQSQRLLSSTISLLRWVYFGLLVAFRNTTLGHPLHTLLFLTRFVHPFKLLLHGTLLSFAGFLSSFTWFLGSCWLLAGYVRSEGTFLGLFLEFEILFRFVCLVLLALAHLVQTFVSWCRSACNTDRYLGSCYFSTSISCFPLGDLRRKRAFFQLFSVLSFLGLFMPTWIGFGLLLG